MLLFNIVYIVFSLGFTFLISRLLRKHGNFFLSNLFPKKPEGTKALMALMDIGFFLVNFGYIFTRVAYGPEAFQSQLDMFRTFAGFVGMQCLLTGALHVVNMAAFSIKGFRIK